MSKNLPAVRPAVALTLSEEFSQARTYLHAAKLAMAQSAAFMVLAGAELERLFKTTNRQQGRHLSRVKGENWDELCQRELGISESTAWRYREMFKAAKKRVPLLNAAQLLDTPLRDLPELKQAQLLEAVQKVTDGETPRQLMMEWGITKKPQGSGATGGKREGAGRKATDAEIVAEGHKAAVGILITLLDEALRDKPWNACEETTRKRLHGLLIDVNQEVKETLA